MKFPLVITCLFLCSVPTALLGQRSLTDSLLKEASFRREQGLYREAIQLYHNVLRLSPKNSRAAYEMASTSFTVKDYEKAMQYARQSLFRGDSTLPDAYVVWGASLDETGKPRKALSVYAEGLKIFPEHYLLYYNQGLAYQHLKDLLGAGTSFAQAVRCRPTHAGSHLMLGYTEMMIGNRPGAWMALNLFLLLEPTSDRSLTAWENIAALQTGMAGHIVTSDLDRDSTASLLSCIENEFSKQKQQSPGDTSTLSLFTHRNAIILRCLPVREGSQNTIWNTLYLPFFNQISANKTETAFSYYISQGARTQETRDWFAGHPEESNRFTTWFEKQDFLQ